MSFVPSVNDVSNNLFLLTVWAENNGKPGEILYEDDVFFPRSPLYGNGPNQFLTYYFTDTVKVAVGTSFFVGWRQLEGDRLNLGLDRNIDNSTVINYSVNGGSTWLTSPFAGSAMIRPIFSTGLDAVLNVPAKEEQKLTIYPNPATEIITVQVESENEEVIIYDSFGRIVKQEIGKSIAIGDLTKGIYFVSVPSISSKTAKFIKL
jgi:hypothetical protein